MVGLLDRVWPSGKAVMAMKVCQWMHRELTTQVDMVEVEASFRKPVELG
eukprot:CAMPEP_0196741798 /NCGR_PEP_ID=MMETSP1091-20130531/42769_1 /TAXON_ID=302021 /ORGANISM="Rhodomonas sp., Strain CCMP768" /LENGTH=48 /DNA_ID= /DNA_START= /DNA_END= /DNA_ORIENTATION=